MIKMFEYELQQGLFQKVCLHYCSIALFLAQSPSKIQAAFFFFFFCNSQVSQIRIPVSIATTPWNRKAQWQCRSAQWGKRHFCKTSDANNVSRPHKQHAVSLQVWKHKRSAEPVVSDYTLSFIIVLGLSNTFQKSQFTQIIF